MDVAIRDVMLSVPQGQSLFSGLRALDVAAVELLVNPDYSFPHLVLEDGSAPFSAADTVGTEKLRERLRAEGVRVSALLIATDFSGEEADAHVDWAVNVIRAAHALGAPVVRLDTATRRKELAPLVIRDNLARRLRQVLEQTREVGVDIGIENHGAFFNDPALLDEVFAAVEDTRLGMTLDTGNFYWYGFPRSELYAILEHFAPRAKHTHIKNINYPPELVETRREIGYQYGRYAAPLDEGNIDVHRVVGILRAAGYTRDLCVENESLGRFAPEERMEILRRDVRTLRAALATEEAG